MQMNKWIVCHSLKDNLPFIKSNQSGLRPKQVPYVEKVGRIHCIQHPHWSSTLSTAQDYTYVSCIFILCVYDKQKYKEHSSNPSQINSINTVIFTV